MTQRKVAFALKKIEGANSKGFYLEALVGNYHLNMDLLKFIYSNCVPSKSDADKKAKLIISEIAAEVSKNQQLKTIVAKKNLKIVKVWSVKMDSFFKTIKYRSPDNTKNLFNETQKIFAILNMSAHKIFAQGKSV